jgi:hypothetical protein
MQQAVPVAQVPMAVPVAAVPVAAVPMQQVAQAAHGLDILAAVPAVFVKQKADIMEAISGYEKANKYKVKEYDPVAKRKGRDLFKAKEKSGCCERQCYGTLRPFYMPFEMDDPGKALVMNLVRPLRCPIYCLCRPVVYVTDDQNRVMGQVTNPFRLCDRTLQITNPSPDAADLEGNPLQMAPGIAADERIHYSIVGDCCQMGFFFPLCAERILFNIYEGDVSEGQPVGQIAREFPGCDKQMLTDADNFSVVFPPNATPAQKATILGAVILLDFTYFEKSGGNEGVVGSID